MTNQEDRTPTTAQQQTNTKFDQQPTQGSSNKMIMIAAGIIIVVLAIAVGAYAYTQRGSEEATTEQTTQKRKISEPTNIIALEERPYIKISPLGDGRNLRITVESLVKPAQAMEYELEYQAGSLLQGAFGLVDLASIPASEQILLGSCSAGGACTYHEDVKGGTLVARFEGPENYALKQDWRYFDNAVGEEAFASKDAKFQIESVALGNQRFVVVYNSPGYPEGLEGAAVSEPYSLETSSSLSGEAELTIRANEEGELTIMGYDGSSWTAFDTTANGKTATAQVKLMQLYVVIQ